MLTSEVGDVQFADIKLGLGVEIRTVQEFLEASGIDAHILRYPAGELRLEFAPLISGARMSSLKVEMDALGAVVNPSAQQ